MKVKEVIEKLKDDGWVQVRQESSHRTFKKDGIANNVAVAGTDNEQVSPGVLSKIRRESGLTLR